jgi:hypothetical protein
VNFHARSLTLQNCSNHINTVNAHVFADLDSLTIHSYVIPHYYLLSHLKRLQIVTCPSITDVSCFRNIPDLTLIECSEITDVSNLANVRVLDLSFCPGIRDVSSLGKVHSLTLTGCSSIEDVSALRNVHKLDLSYCSRIRDISSLSNVYSLKLQDFQGSDVSGLVNVVVLDIS